MAKKSSKRLLIVALVFFGLASFCYVPAHAQQGSSQVGAVLCDSTGPDVQVSQPVSDSVVTQPTVPLEGTAERTSQIDIFINGVYSHSVALGFNPAFQTSVTLQEGTNTITLEAHFSCNQTSSTTAIVVDYHPIVTPTDPGTVDTDLGGQSSGTQQSRRVQRGASQPEAPQDELGILETIKDKLGLGDEPDDPSAREIDRSYVKIAFNWLIFVSIIVLFGLLFSSAALVGKLVALTRLDRHENIKHPHRFMRVVIALLIALLAFILAS